MSTPDLHMTSLSSFERGFVLASALANEGPEAAAGLSGPEAERCAVALQQVATLPRDHRTWLLARLARDVHAAVPRGFERVHPAWLEELLAGEASPILLAVAAGLPAAVVAVVESILVRRAEAPTATSAAEIEPEALAEVRRSLLGILVPMPDETESVAGRLCDLPPSDLAEEIATLGARTLGHSLAGAPLAVRARAAAAAGERWRQLVLAAASGPPTRESRDEARAVVAAACGSELSAPAVTLVGLEALRRTLAAGGGDAARQVAQRLPPELGRRLLSSPGKGEEASSPW